MGYKLIACIAVGAIFTGCALAIAGYFITIQSTDGGLLGPENDAWPIAVVVNFIAGSIVGGISAAVIAGFNFGLIKALLFSGLLNILVVATFFFLTHGGMSEAIRYSLYALVPIGFINGVIVFIVAVASQTD